MDKSPLRNDGRVVEHLELVYPIANRFAKATGQDRDDLIQVGRLGLIRAAARFNSSMTTPFQVFARPHIRGAILHYLRDSIGLIRLPRTVQEQAQRALKRQRCSDDITRTNRLISSAEEQQAVHAYSQRNRWIDLNDCPQMDRLEEVTDGIDKLISSEHQRVIAKCWMSLNNEQKRCIKAVIVEGRSLRDTAQMLNRSAMTVQRRVKSGLRQLSVQCRDAGVTGGRESTL